MFGLVFLVQCLTPSDTYYTVNIGKEQELRGLLHHDRPLAVFTLSLDPFIETCAENLVLNKWEDHKWELTLSGMCHHRDQRR